MQKKGAGSDKFCGGPLLIIGGAGVIVFFPFCEERKVNQNNIQINRRSNEPRSVTASESAP
jgi:hypothetical protein